ncbi:MAG: MarR family EPS-associated transcriptional regulator [Xanthomonadales bacterium]|jgi:EPS-associated MarR family transcriptional regulator|nr:MarR family EPS-associated transcriptional regulator [Xanthomonadales bacterium]
MRSPQGGSVPEGGSKATHRPIQETHLKLLRYLEAHPQVSQRELSEHLGVSLGKTNYCLRALKEKGLVKARNFKNNRSKRAYLYILTPKGLEAKARITARFLQRKMDEYERLKGEIEMLKAELEERQAGARADKARPGPSDPRPGGTP